MINTYSKNSVLVKYFLPVLITFFGITALASAQKSTDSNHPFESEIVAFEKSDAQNPPPKHAILFVGSSSIRKWTTLKQDFPDKQVINRGFGGSQFADLLYYANRIVFPYQPRQIFVYEGDNDVAAGVSPKMIFSRFKTFIQQVKKRLPGTEVVFISIKPSPSRSKLFDKMQQANTSIKNYTKELKNVRYVDIVNPMLDDKDNIRPDIFVDDNLHMNAKGYDIWQSVIRPYLD